MKKKRILALILSVAMLFGVMPKMPLFANETVESVYYVAAEGGDDSNEGTSAENAFATLGKAIQALNDVNADRKVIKIVGTASISGNVETHSDNIIITGNDDNAVLDITDHIYPKGPLTFENIKISNSERIEFKCERSTMVFGTGVTMTQKDANSYPNILTGNYGAYESNANTNPARESVTIDSGNFYQIRLGASATNKSGISSSVVNGVDLTMNGGWAYSLLLGADGGWLTYTAGNEYIDDVNIVINGGTIAGSILWSDTSGVDASTLNGNAVQLIFNNGTQAPADVLTETDITNHDGIFYRLNCAAQTGSYLETTDTAGTYTVNGDLYAVATDTTDSTNVYYSKDGQLVVPAGTYDVTWTSELETVREVYVSASGSDDNDGTKDTPFVTLTKAVKTIEASEYNGVINIIGTFTISSTDGYYVMENHSKEIVIQGADDTALLEIGCRFDLGGPLTIDNIKVHATVTGLPFVCGRHAFSFGSNAELSWTDTNTSNAPTIITGLYGAWEIDSPVRENVVIDNGEYYTIYLGNRATAGTISGGYSNSAGVDFVQNNGRIYKLFLGADGWASDRLGGTNYSGDVNFTMNGGRLDRIVMDDTTGVNPTKYNDKAIQLIFNNGTGVVDASTLPTTEAVTAKGGYLYIMNCAMQGGTSYLSTTEKAGTYTVHGELKAVATNTDGKEYESVNGVLTVEPGIYTVTWELDDSPLTVFVDETNGADANDGLTTATAFKTLNAAVDAIQNSDCATGTITVIGTVTIDDSLQSKSLSSHSKMITIQGNDSLSVLHLNRKTLTTNGPLTIEKITVKLTAPDSGYIGFDSDTYEFNLGENIINETYPYMELMAGPTNKNSGELELSMDSGNLYRIVAGAFNNTDNNTDEINGLDYVHNGGQLSILYLGSNAWDGNGLQFYSTAFTGNVNITLNGGQVGEISLLKPIADSISQTNRDVYFREAVQILINNKGFMTNPLPEIKAEGGLWVMNGHGSGYDLTVTDEAGVYNVPDGVIAIAYSEDGSRTYVSKDGVLEVSEPGTYTVEYKTELDYTNSGTTITFYQDVTIDSLADFAVKDFDGKLFAGWMNGDKVVDSTTTSFTKDTILTAKYIDCNMNDNGDFFIKGSQIRERGEAQTLRFVIQLSDSVSEAFGTVEYGSVYALNKVLGTKELEKGGSYLYDEVTYNATTVSGTEWKSTDAAILYTGSVDNIAVADYQVNYAVKGYLTYTDLNGISRTVYTNEMVTSVADTAEKLLKIDAEDESLLQIIADGKAAMQEKYSGTNSVTTTGTFGSNFNNGTIMGTNGEVALTFNQLDNGLTVRDVTISAVNGNGSGGETTVVQVSDPHFNYSNEEDVAEGNPSTMSTWKNRDLNKLWNGNLNQSIYNFANSLEYAEAYGDKTIITGDVLDYISYGTLGLMERYVNLPYSDALVTLGNHDPIRVMGLQTDIADASTVTSRYNLLQENWNNNVYYTSEMVSDEVMVIQLDNGQNKFWKSQIEKLETDLATARENDYTVLLFMHIPMVTGDAGDTDVQALIATDDESYNFYNGNIIKKSINGDTEAVYNLITSHGDVIKGIFTGHMHSDFYTEVQAKDAKDDSVYIPQYVLTGNFYDKGHVLKITVK